MLCAQHRELPVVEDNVVVGAEVASAIDVTGTAVVDGGFGATPGVRVREMFPRRDMFCGIAGTLVVI